METNKGRGRRRVSLTLLLLLLSGLWLTACVSPTPLPTIIPTAQAPSNQPFFVTDREIPATYTVVPTLTPGQPTPTLKATVPRSPTPPPLLSPTPTPFPALLLDINDAPYLAQPPQTVSCDGPGLIFRSQFPSEMGGPWRDYHAYLPPCYGQDGFLYPVLYLIHGSIQTDTHWLNLGLAQHADSGIANGRYPPFIAIMPYNDAWGNITSGGDKSIEGIMVKALLPYVDTHFCSWNVAAGRSIGGISRGGYWALEIAFRHTDLFTAVAGHSSHLRFETDGPRYNPLATYATADLSQMRIWLDRGETDFLRLGQDQLHNNLTEAGIAHEYYINPGGHNDIYWATHLSEYLDWHTALWPTTRTLYPGGCPR